MKSALHVILIDRAKTAFESLSGFGVERYIWQREGSTYLLLILCCNSIIGMLQLYYDEYIAIISVITTI